MKRFNYTGSVGETDVVVFDFTEDLATPRYDSFEYALTDFVTIGAFVYECTNAGKTACDAPEFSTTIGDVVTDGSVEWTCRDYSASGTDTIDTKSVTAASGLTVDSDTLEKNTRIVVGFTLDTAGLHELVCEITTVGGKTLKQFADIVIA